VAIMREFANFRGQWKRREAAAEVPGGLRGGRTDVTSVLMRRVRNKSKEAS
jgi:hypothetical protein